MNTIRTVDWIWFLSITCCHSEVSIVMISHVNKQLTVIIVFPERDVGMYEKKPNGKCSLQAGRTRARAGTLHARLRCNVAAKSGLTGPRRKRMGNRCLGDVFKSPGSAIDDEVTTDVEEQSPPGRASATERGDTERGRKRTRPGRQNAIDLQSITRWSTNKTCYGGRAREKCAANENQRRDDNATSV